MAQKVEILLVDDLDGTKAAETLTFAIDGAAYEIDLNEKNATKLRQSLGKYVDNGRRLNGKRQARRPSANTREIREWARSKGMEVSATGAISKGVREAYAQAHS